MVALPIGLYLGHRGTGELLAVAHRQRRPGDPRAGADRLMAAVIGVGVLNLTIALAVLGIPPILTNAFVGIRQVDRATVDAARGIGHDRVRDPPQGRDAAGDPDPDGRDPRRHDRDRRDGDDRAAGRGR